MVFELFFSFFCIVLGWFRMCVVEIVYFVFLVFFGRASRGWTYGCFIRLLSRVIIDLIF